MMQTIHVEQGLILLLQFTAFFIHYEYDDYTIICPNDHLTITDGDNTTLMDKGCGRNRSTTLPAFVTKSNTVNLLFITNSKDTRTGWSVSWSAVTPGECQQDANKQIKPSLFSHPF